MKKLKAIVSLLLIVSISFSLIISCSNESKIEDATATVSFGRVNSSRGLSSSVGIPGERDLYWSVTATKNDSGLASGAGTYALNADGAKGISNSIKLTLSVGSWSFTLNGYTDSTRSDVSKIYSGSTNEILQKNESKTINVDVSYCGSTNGFGTVQLENIELSNANTSEADSLKIEVFSADNLSSNVVTTTIRKDNSNKFSGMIMSEYNPAQLTPGVYKFRFTLVKDNREANNPLERYVIVLQGRNTKITGDIAEEQGNISFYVNILSDSYAQFGKYFYVLVGTEEAYQKALQAAANYQGEETPIIILSQNLEVDNTTINNSASRAIEIDMNTPGLVIDLNGYELKLKETSEASALITLDANKSISVIDTASNGTINAPGKVAIDVKQGSVSIEGGKVIAKTAATVSSTASLAISNVTIDASEKAVINAGTFTMTSGTISAPIAIEITDNNASTSIQGGALEANKSIATAEGIEAEVQISNEVKNEGSISGNVKESFGSGTGTEEDPYIISSLNQLKYFASKVNSGTDYSGQFIKLGADIQLESGNWNPIGCPKVEIVNDREPSSDESYYYGFAGSFDGDNHVIKELWFVESSGESSSNTLKYSKFKGLFGIVKDGACIKNVIIENVHLEGVAYSGSLVGYIPKPQSGTATVRLENNTVKGNIFIFGFKNIGGLVGRAETNTKLELVGNKILANNGSGSQVSMNMNGGNLITSTNFFGGIIGSAYGNSTITNNTVENLIVLGNTEGIGGIAGHVLQASFTNNTVTNCEIMNNYMGSSYPNDSKGIGIVVGLVGAGDGCNKDNCTHANVNVSISGTNVNDVVIRLIADKLNCQGLVGTYRCDKVDGIEPTITGVTNKDPYVEGLSIEYGITSSEMLKNAIANVGVGTPTTIYPMPPMTEGVTSVTYDISNVENYLGEGKTLTIKNLTFDSKGNYVSAPSKIVIQGYLLVTGNLNLQNITIAHEGNNTTKNNNDTISQYYGTAIAVMNGGSVKAEDCVFNVTGNDNTAITSWWSTGKGTLIDVKNCIFNCKGQRPIRSDANVNIEKCTFNDPYRYAVQLTSKADTATGIEKAVVNFKNNTIVAGTTTTKPVYGVQLEGEDYGCSNLIINGSGNTINLNDTGKVQAMYYCECGKVKHDSITWNTEVEPVHKSTN